MKTSNSLVRRWTDSAIQCYERGCQCQGCEINNLHLSFKCAMKLTVRNLVKIHGLPENIKSKGVLPEEVS